MEHLKSVWSKVPVSVRKPIILVVGLAFVIISPFTGVLPGPGGIPVFLIGIAILATEYEWAKRLRDWSLRWIRLAGQAWRQHKVIGTTALLAALVVFAAFSVFAYRYLHHTL